MPEKNEYEKMLDVVAKHLIDQGKLIEAGFHMYREMAIPKNAPEIQVAECRIAFFAGAQHTMGSIMSTLDSGEEATLEDMNRLENIMKELEEFGKAFILRMSSVAGNG